MTVEEMLTKWENGVYGRQATITYVASGGENAARCELTFFDVNIGRDGDVTELAAHGPTIHAAVERAVELYDSLHKD